ncbi:Coenzyme F420 hydrogenase/dehydrogenase, beta subunit C-terminal domain [Xylanibacter rodentium]|uniref:Coenzyme F420 hydrogenase/dehydrogenase, beta subunit C-terminal domain n=1 Tax=Xylanibacter rodentium TaxID=2736289 RepID=UPI000F49C010|nr:Coenzyme F420 hydrogenase/dehydrogenase, beta subunit C-terminal domain [Xylanibacter rodentium]ROT17601.1 hypothetical protein EEL51_12170 [Muribaculaceae bacterium Isolate-110 (HZI)]
MPELAGYNDCTGCQACKFICPKRCIEMRENDAGVVLPKIDASCCIECKTCEKICPAQNPVKFNSPKRVYAAWNTSPFQRNISASGGIASAIYMWLKNIGGISTGAFIDSDWSVKICIFRPGDSFDRLSNSKYSYSDPSEIYEEVRPYIKEGKIVVFIGLPCQIAGYKKTFGNKDNLYYVDLVCHGVAPNSYLRQHISKIEQKVGVRAAEMSFRAPEMGTANYYFTLYDNDGKISYAKRSIDGDNYNIAFHRGYSYRENCYHCHYARPERCSDLTIGDYHGLGKLQPCDFDNDNVSVILANTDKGNELLKRLIDAELVAVYERPVEEPIQGDSQLRHPTLKSKFRYDFEKYIVRYNGNFEMTVTKVLKNQKQREAATRVYSLPKRVVKKILRICHICN